MPPDEWRRNLPASSRPRRAALLDVRPVRCVCWLPQSWYVRQQSSRRQAPRDGRQCRAAEAPPTSSWNSGPCMAEQQAQRTRKASRIQGVNYYRPSSWIRRYWNVFPLLALVALASALVFGSPQYDSRPTPSHYEPLVRHPVGEWKTNCPQPVGMNPKYCRGPTR